MYKYFFLMLSFAFLLQVSAQDIKLTAPNKEAGKPLMKALSERKSMRDFKKQDLPISVLSNLLWAANGFNREDKRTSPTANNKQEIELYVTLKSGVYFYDAKNQLLKLIKSGDFREQTGMQDFVADVPLNIIFVADMEKASSREYAYTDCGYISQNIYLFAASEGLATVVRGSFDKDSLTTLLKLPSNQEVLLTQSVGYPKE
ncbi:MAG TPA: SagB/ThcOx family dehydrogenase [Dysgonamonadaceae bacterium]|nr:SagB/ThcOx family dehydrogenase [Dysgonamonadaceae bacterium]